MNNFFKSIKFGMKGIIDLLSLSGNYALTTMFGLVRQKMPVISFQEAYSGALFKACKIHANQMCKAKIILSKPNGEQLQPSDNLYKIFYGIDNRYKFDELMAYFSLHLNLYGMAFWLVIKTGSIIDIDIIHPSRVKLISTNGNRVDGATIDGKEAKLNEELFVMRSVSPEKNMANNYSVYLAVEWLLAEWLLMHRNKAGTLENDGTPPFMLTLPNAKKDDLEKAKKDYDAGHSGGVRNVLWLTGAWQKQDFNIDSQTLLYINALPEVEKSIYHIFGIPELMYGSPAAYNKANIDAAYAQYLLNEVVPTAKILENCLKLIFLVFRIKANIEVGIDIPRDTELYQRLVMDQYRNGIITKKHVRKLLGIAIDVEEVEEQLLQYILPSNFIRIDINGNRLDDPQPVTNVNDVNKSMIIKVIKKAFSKYNTPSEIKEDITKYLKTHSTTEQMDYLQSVVGKIFELVDKNTSMGDIINYLRITL